MPLAWRPTGLTNPLDWTVEDAAGNAARVYHSAAHNDPGQRWFWVVNSRARFIDGGHAASREAAFAAARACWVKTFGAPPAEPEGDEWAELQALLRGAETKKPPPR